MFKHIVGDGIMYRQAMAFPVRRATNGVERLKLWTGHLPTLLVERTNGQLVCVRIIYPAVDEINLSEFIHKVEQVIPVTKQKVKTHQGEVLVRIGVDGSWRLSISDAVIDTIAPSLFSSAIPALAEAIYRDMCAKPCQLAPSDINCVIHQLKSDLHRQLGSAISTFESNLDDRIVTTIKRSGETLSTNNYNGYQSLSRTARKRRLQAAEIFPLIGAHLTEKGKPFAGLRRAIDRATPMFAELAKAIDVPIEVVRWLAGKDVTTVGVRWNGRLIDLAHELACLCPEHRPQTIDDWKAFNELTLATGQLAPLTEVKNQNHATHTKIMREIGKIGWIETKSRLANKGAITSDLADINDLLDELINVLAEDLGEGGTLSEVLQDALEPHVRNAFFSLGIFRQLETSLLWHRLLNTTARSDGPSSGAMEQNESWPAAFDGIIEISGLHAVCLTNRMQLKDEGLIMQHCVRTYADQCLFNGTSIVSFQRADGLRVSTAQLQLTESESSKSFFELRQHRGIRNEPPSDDARFALNGLLLRLNANEYHDRRESLKKELHKRKVLNRHATKGLVGHQRQQLLKTALKHHIGYERLRSTVAPYAYPF